jgi:hypothetical protein
MRTSHAARLQKRCLRTHEVNDIGNAKDPRGVQRRVLAQAVAYYGCGYYAPAFS